MILPHTVKLIGGLLHAKLPSDPVRKPPVKDLLLHHINIISNVIADLLDGIHLRLRHRKTIGILRNDAAA